MIVELQTTGTTYGFYLKNLIFLFKIILEIYILEKIREIIEGYSSE